LDKDEKKWKESPKVRLLKGKVGLSFKEGKESRSTLTSGSFNERKKKASLNPESGPKDKESLS